MKSQPYLIGVDAASDKADVHVHGPDDEELGHFVMEATNSSIRSVLAKLPSLVDTENSVVILEATAVYHRIYYYAFKNSGFHVVVVNPYQIHTFQKALSLRKTKTDKISAHTLAVAYRSVQAQLRTKGDTYLDLREHVRTYYHHIDEQSGYRRRILLVLAELFPLFPKRFPNPFSQTALALLYRYPTPQAVLAEDPKRLFNFIKAVSRQNARWAIEKLNQLLLIARESPTVPVATEAKIDRLRSFIDSLHFHQMQAEKIRYKLQRWATEDRQLRLLLTIPGIGIVLAATILAEIEDIHSFEKPAQLVAFCGIDPSVRESGNFKGSRNHMSKRGPRLLRRALYLAVVCAIGVRRDHRIRNPYLRAYYEKKRAQGKPPKVAIGACMRKMACYVFSTLKHGEPFTLIDPAKAAWRKAA